MQMCVCVHCNYLDDQVDIRRRVSDGKNGGPGLSRRVDTGRVGPQKTLHLFLIQIKVKIL